MRYGEWFSPLAPEKNTNAATHKQKEVKEMKKKKQI